MCRSSQGNSSTTPELYQLTCSVCKGQFNRRNDWLKHLTQENHQKLARLECLEKWEWDSEIRKSSLVIYTSTKLTSGTAEEIVNYFSNQFNDTVVLVTDFVWWEDRPQLGILQFESRWKVKDILKEVGSKGSTIISIGEGLCVQVQAGSKLMKLEWHAILPPSRKSVISRTKINQENSPTNPTKHNSSSRPNRKPESGEREDSPPSKTVKLDESIDNTATVIISKKPVNVGSPPNFSISDQTLPSTLTPTQPISMDLDDMPLSKRLKLRIDQSTLAVSIKNASSGPISKLLRSDQPPPPSMNSTSHPLQFEYWAIRNAILIPDEQYNQAMELVSSMKTIFSKLIPNLKFHPFRNWYLKLKYPDEQPELLLFVHGPRKKFIDDLSVKLRKFLSYRSSLRHLSVSIDENPKENENDDILHLTYLPANLKLSLITPKVTGSLMEFQVCRLLEYLCQFDPRCHPLITLACYWVSVNSIDLTGESSQPENPLELPPHYTIQWLVIFFMAQANYIPSPRQIRNGNLTDEITGVKIGFSWDPNYVQDWRNDRIKGFVRSATTLCPSFDENSEEFLLSLLQLFQKFLCFCHSTLGNNTNWVLNTFDGMLIDIKDLKSDLNAGRQDRGNYQWKKKDVKPENVNKLKNAVEMEISVKGKCEMYMTHPFLFDHKMLLADNIKDQLRKFCVGDGKLQIYLKYVADSGVPAALTKLRSLKDVLTNQK